MDRAAGPLGVVSEKGDVMPVMHGSYHVLGGADY